MDPPRYRAGTVTKTASRRWRGRLKSDFHTGLCLCLWCLCSSSEPMVVSSRCGAASRGCLHRDQRCVGRRAAIDGPLPRLRAAARVRRPLPDGCPFCFVLISEFYARGTPKDVVGLVEWPYEQEDKPRTADLGRRSSFDELAAIKFWMKALNWR